MGVETRRGKAENRRAERDEMQTRGRRAKETKQGKHETEKRYSAAENEQGGGKNDRD